jgi:hypothetical protein
MTRGRRDCRHGQPCDVRTLAEAIYCAVHHSDLDARAVAERLGVRYTYLMDAANPDREEVQFQARLIVPAGAREVFDAGNRAVREFGEALTVWGASVADGTVTADELPTIRREAHEAIAAISALVQLAEAQVRPSVAPFFSHSKAGL